MNSPSNPSYHGGRRKPIALGAHLSLEMDLAVQGITLNLHPKTREALFLPPYLARQCDGLDQNFSLLLFWNSLVIGYPIDPIHALYEFRTEASWETFSESVRDAIAKIFTVACKDPGFWDQGEILRAAINSAAPAPKDYIEEAYRLLSDALSFAHDPVSILAKDLDLDSIPSSLNEWILDSMQKKGLSEPFSRILEESEKDSVRKRMIADGKDLESSENIDYLDRLRTARDPSNAEIRNYLEHYNGVKVTREQVKNIASVNSWNLSSSRVFPGKIDSED